MFWRGVVGYLPVNVVQGLWVSAYPRYRVARALKRAPLRGLWRPLLKAYSLIEGAPVKTRAFAMRLYRAALYAEAV